LKARQLNYNRELPEILERENNIGRLKPEDHIRGEENVFRPGIYQVRFSRFPKGIVIIRVIFKRKGRKVTMAGNHIFRLRGNCEDVDTNNRGITVISCRMVVLKGSTRHQDARTVNTYHEAIQYENMKHYI